LKIDDNISGFANNAYGGSINNCHVINAKMEGEYINGFCGLVSNGCQITNSSLIYSTLISTEVAVGFAHTIGGFISGCFVSNCVVSAEYEVYGFSFFAQQGEINNCYVQATLLRTGATQSYSRTAGFTSLFGYQGGEGQTPLPIVISNCYTACEIASIDNDADVSRNASFGLGCYPNATFTNCYYLTHPIFPAFTGTAPTSGVIGKSEMELKDAAMVANAASSLNHNQNSPLPWKQDLMPSINKGYPILSWQQHLLYVSTYYPANLTETSATLQGFVFTNGETIAERGFQWRVAGTGNWTTVQISDTTANISHSLTGLNKNTTYEYFTYIKTSATQHGDTVQFVFGNVGISETIQDAEIRIYPNPTDGKITISNEQSTIKSIGIFNVVGQVVGTWQATSTETTIDISHLTNGIYFMKIDGKTVKIVKQ
jgi:hypothetical protein